MRVRTETISYSTKEQLKSTKEVINNVKRIKSPLIRISEQIKSKMWFYHTNVCLFFKCWLLSSLLVHPSVVVFTSLINDPMTLPNWSLNRLYLSVRPPPPAEEIRSSGGGGGNCCSTTEMGVINFQIQIRGLLDDTHPLTRYFGKAFPRLLSSCLVSVTHPRLTMY